MKLKHIHYPHSPDELTVNILHAIGKHYLHVHPKRHHLYFVYCWDYDARASQRIIAHDLKHFPSHDFSPRLGWLTLADVWYSSAYYSKDACFKEELLTGIMGTEVENCFLSAFKHIVRGTDKEVIYREMIELINQAYPQNRPAIAK